MDTAAWKQYMHAISDMERRLNALNPDLSKLECSPVLNAVASRHRRDSAHSSPRPAAAPASAPAAPQPDKHALRGACVGADSGGRAASKGGPGEMAVQFSGAGSPAKPGQLRRRASAGQPDLLQMLRLERT